MALKKTDQYLYLERAVDKYFGSILTWLISRARPDQSAIANSKNANINRILLIKLHGIGNIVMLLPSIRLLKKAYPEARIDFLTFDSNREIIEGIDEISEIIILSRNNLRAVLSSVQDCLC